jgi:hypothetical protein
MYRLIVVFALLIMGTVRASAQSLPVPSYWLNQRGSEMKLYQIDPDGSLKGYYINHAAGFECQGLPGYDLVGHAWRDHVRFIMEFTTATQEPCGTVE